MQGVSWNKDYGLWNGISNSGIGRICWTLQKQPPARYNLHKHRESDWFSVDFVDFNDKMILRIYNVPYSRYIELLSSL